MKTRLARKAPAAPEVIEEQKVVPQTPEEQAIAARVRSQQDDKWAPIGEDSSVDYSQIGRDPFELPPPAKSAREKRKYAFRWITRKAERIDEMRNKPAPFTWRICNRMTTPFLAAYVDPVLGCVCREDQVLVYKPWSWFEREQAYKQGLAKVQAESGELQRKHGTNAGESLEWTAGVRQLGSGKPSKAEVSGGDVIMVDESLDGGEPVGLDE